MSSEVDFKVNLAEDSSAEVNDDESKLFRDLFTFYDSEKKGYISIENFIAITKENMKNEEEVKKLTFK
jgi:Ca2+-binding EF-hand superfamily protein